METAAYPRLITEELFKKLDDSPERLLIFKELFPDGKMPLTEEAILRGWDAGLHIVEMIRHLLSQKDLPDFESALSKAVDEYSEVTDQAIAINRPESGEDKKELRKVLLDAALAAALRAHRKTIAETIVKFTNRASTENSS